ncbi:choline uptake/conversion transcriptional regulator CudC [Cytobacillus purgationiresistens]|uniref:HTH-type transcriptional regulator n=1 Tax=Cytobacillus purgationiresistens TaxID=863449 RepID=A0ABU0AHV4_9BACI|nr:GbsR/MarR family transcriptional regulator [Cytobacillus purgationiresistens]MDQ0270836.1 DNA-binding transcriptional regulator GbsR (MarR family) [Cytobacillus purgationiresistens]
MNEQEKLDRARERVIETISQNMNLYGITPSIGRLYGLLYFKDHPMTLDEMKEELGMSKTSMSTSVRSLQEMKMVEKVWKKGSRKDQYQAEEDWHQTFVDLFTTKWRPSISINIIAIEKSIFEMERILEAKEVTEEIKAAASDDIKKLHNALQYYDWLNRLVDSFESGEIFDLVSK